MPDLPLFEILSRLSNNDLKNICQSNKRFNGFIIDNEYFWQIKVALSTPVKYKYYMSWYLTYKNISSIPVFINIDKSKIYGDRIYFDRNFSHLECEYNASPCTYIKYYPGETFEAISKKIYDYCSRVTPNYVAMYFKDQMVLGASSEMGNTTFKAGITPNKILVFNDNALRNNYNCCCHFGWGSFEMNLIDNNMEYCREIYRMVCKEMIKQYPKINIYKLIYAIHHRLDDEFKLGLESQ